MLVILGNGYKEKIAGSSSGYGSVIIGAGVSTAANIPVCFHAGGDQTGALWSMAEGWPEETRLLYAHARIRSRAARGRTYINGVF